MSPLGSPIALSFKSQDTQVTSKQREQVENPPTPVPVTYWHRPSTAASQLCPVTVPLG